jgi:hypothetical protein
MNYERLFSVLMAGIALASFGGMLYTVHSFGDASDRMESLSSDLRDGSLDNYTKKEANNIIDNYGSQSSAPVLMWGLGIIAGAAGLFAVILYENDKIPEEVKNQE